MSSKGEYKKKWKRCSRSCNPESVAARNFSPLRENQSVAAPMKRRWNTVEGFTSFSGETKSCVAYQETLLFYRVIFSPFFFLTMVLTVREKRAIGRVIANHMSYRLAMYNRNHPQYLNAEERGRAWREILLAVNEELPAIEHDQGKM